MLVEILAWIGDQKCYMRPMDYVLAQRNLGTFIPILGVDNVACIAQIIRSVRADESVPGSMVHIRTEGFSFVVHVVDVIPERLKVAA